MDGKVDLAADAPIIAASIAFFGVLVSASVAYITASRSVYVNAVTTAKIRSLEKMRDVIIEFREDFLQIAMQKRDGKQGDEKLALNINRNFERLSLELGNGRNEDNVLNIMTHCMKFCADFEKAMSYSQKLQNHAHWLLQTEWMRTRFEAGSALSRPFNALRMFARRVSYARFSNGDGRYEDMNIDRTKLYMIQQEIEASDKPLLPRA